MENLIRSVLAPAQLKPKYLDILVKSARRYEREAFTSPSVDPKVNYEINEILGDATAGKFITWYFYERFPQLDCAKAVKVIARLKINYASKKVFSDIAKRLGFDSLIRAGDHVTPKEWISILEDVFEAFIGLTERILDETFTRGVGYAVVYDMLKSIYDEMDISLAYENLYDAKTRLKQLFDSNKQLGRVVYESQGGNSSIVYQISSEGKTKMGQGYGLTKSEQEQQAATEAIALLKQKGIIERQDESLFCE